MDDRLQDYINQLDALDFSGMYGKDFFLTWEKTDEEIETDDYRSYKRFSRSPIQKRV